MRINFHRDACSDAIAACYEMFQHVRLIPMVTPAIDRSSHGRSSPDSSRRELTLNTNSQSYVLIVQRVFASHRMRRAHGDPKDPDTRSQNNQPVGKANCIARGRR